MKIGIYGQSYKKETAIYIDELLNILQENNIEVFIEVFFYNLIQQENNTTRKYKTFSNYKDLNNTYNLLLSVGGDGTFLRAITYIRNSNIPILGINTGRLGFLANIKKENIKEAIIAIIKKEYSLRERTILKVTTKPEIKELHEINIALNEVTIVRKNTTAMLTLKTFLDNEYLATYWADGLIFSTPTGSTGYSLSCGGPVITPSSKSLLITPIAPHNLNVRPLIINDDTKIKVTLLGREKQALISLDSRIITIPKGTEVFIKKASYSIKTILLNKQSFLKTLRDKLLWGEDIRNV
ncbi:MAG: NAD kinase [Flavobacteriaceae bacterium]|nr:NAD kinase [Flavobacteriaceae bacterium]